MQRYAFLRSPIWIAGIAIALVTVIAFVSLGLWQLRRLDERRAINATIEARATAEPSPLGIILATHGTESDALVYRRVSVAGTYDHADEVLIVGTTLNQSGNDVLTPLRFDGVTIAVNRGWVPIDAGGPPVVGAEPPVGAVEVTGILLEGQTFGSLGTPEEDGRYDRVGRIDLDALTPQWGSDLLPVYLLLESQDPAGGELPMSRPPPEPSDGSHLSYAAQWFMFAIIAAIGFPVLIYRTGR